MTDLAQLMLSIPSPGSGEISIGPLTFRAYGLMIAAGVVAAVWLVGRRMRERGIHPDHAAMLAMWVVPGGLVGARLYHVITDWRRFEGRWGDVFKIWEGGLGILGGVLMGAAVGVLFARHHKIPLPDLLDIAAPALPLAQAIGRWGNYFNQELFGKPTDVAWALEIDREHRPLGFQADETFHPTFLYESLWNLGVVALVIWVDRQRVLKRGYLFALYLGAYAIGRLWIENLRIDTATELWGARVNLWVYGALLLVCVALLVRGTNGRRGDDHRDADAVTDDDGDDEDADTDRADAKALAEEE